jgi:hypothetical protein
MADPWHTWQSRLRFSNQKKATITRGPRVPYMYLIRALGGLFLATSASFDHALGDVWSARLPGVHYSDRSASSRFLLSLLVIVCFLLVISPNIMLHCIVSFFSFFQHSHRSHVVRIDFLSRRSLWTGDIAFDTPDSGGG